MTSIKVSKCHRNPGILSALSESFGGVAGGTAGGVEAVFIEIV
jgi:hypothetical protein